MQAGKKAIPALESDLWLEEMSTGAKTYNRSGSWLSEYVIQAPEGPVCEPEVGNNALLCQ